MRRFIFFTAIIGLLFSAEAQKTDTTGFEGFKAVKLSAHQNLIKTSLFPFLVGQIPWCGEARFTYERMITHNQSFLAGVSYNYPNPVLLLSALVYNTSFKQYSLRGVRGILGYRIYPFKKSTAPEGFFAGGYLSYNFVKVKERNGNGDYFSFNYANASAVAGYQMYLGENFYGEAFGGIGYRYNFIRAYDASTRKSSTQEHYLLRGLKNIKFVLQVNVSYAF